MPNETKSLDFNYPLRFKPQLQYRLWGGNRLVTDFNKAEAGNQIGESWEISTVPGFESEIVNGALKGQNFSDIIAKAPEAVLGKKVTERFGSSFPLLIKFIDAKTPLSVQVHPNDALAQQLHNSFGKNEMWYVLQAEPEAELIVGFNQKMDRPSYENALAENRLEEILHREKVSAGDMVYIPTGTIHAIGAGVLLAEIQQSSDVTYRVYDYNRVDVQTGKTRELHADLALDAIDYTIEKPSKLPYPKHLNKVNPVIDTPYFKTTFLPISGKVERLFQVGESFRIYICTQGSLQLNGEAVKKGDSILIPALLDHLIWEGTGDVLEVCLD